MNHCIRTFSRCLPGKWPRCGAHRLHAPGLCRAHLSAQVHVPVMRDEIIECFESENIQVFLDGTLGAGGHAAALIDGHKEMQRFLGCDQDPSALAAVGPMLQARAVNAEVELLHCNFRDISTHLEQRGLVGKVDGMLFDLGVSSTHLDQADRGFSFMRDGARAPCHGDLRTTKGPLDMRMDTTTQGPTAADIVNLWPEQHIGKILREYGEEKSWHAIARRIVDARTRQALLTTQQLVDAVGAPRKGGRGKAAWAGRARSHPATRTFQAIRIAVNDELAALEAMLPQSIECLRPGGLLAVISFHSLEDRIVKNAFKKAAGKVKESTELMAARARGIWLEDVTTDKAEKVIELVTMRPVLPSCHEVQTNPRARSAKLRVVKKLPNAAV